VACAAGLASGVPLPLSRAVRLVARLSKRPVKYPRHTSNLHTSSKSAPDRSQPGQVKPEPSTMRILRSTKRPKKTVAAENRNTLSNRREKTLKAGSVSRREVVDSDKVDGSEMSDVRR